MVAEGKTTTITVDVQAGEILRRAAALALAKGETLGAYLGHSLPPDVVSEKSSSSQRQAWEAFVKGMTAWSASNLPAAHIADDARDSMYDDRK
jgi:hypothetical protein